jgi:hypothetical protein
MKNQPLILSAILATAVLASCGKEELKNKQSDAALNFRSGSSSISVTANWAEGATNLINETADPAQTAKTVTIWNDLGNVNRGRIGFQRWDQTGAGHFGRTNNNTTGGKDGDALHAFAFATTNWTAKVPFAFGTNANGTREAIWTPSFVNVGIATANSALFVTDNGTGDEDATAGIIEVGDFRALDEDVRPGGGSNNRVVFQKWNGSSWAQIGRTNGSGDNGDLLAFAVVNARTAYTVSGGKVNSQTVEAIPVVKLLRSNGKTFLLTDLPNQTVGTAKMYEY